VDYVVLFALYCASCFGVFKASRSDSIKRPRDNMVSREGTKSHLIRLIVVSLAT